MSNRPAVKSAFANLRPSIIREPTQSAIAPEDELKLLKASSRPDDVKASVEQAFISHPQTTADSAPTLSFQAATLLTKKRREVLIPVTFRIPQTLKEKLNEIAKRHELNQTDLINEGIELNLQRYS